MLFCVLSAESPSQITESPGYDFNQRNRRGSSCYLDEGAYPIRIFDSQSVKICIVVAGSSISACAKFHLRGINVYHLYCEIA